MTLQEIFDQLTYGELSQLSIGGSEAGAIDENNYVRVLPHINLALTAIYKRFPLKEGRTTLTLVPGTYSYAFTSSDILKIERVLTTDKFELVLNDIDNPYSVTTPDATTLVVPEDIANQVADLPDELKTTTLEIVFRANHPKIVQGPSYFDPAVITVQLPETHLEPLLLFIAARMMTPIGAGQLEGFAHTTLISRYEAACLQIEQKNLGIDQNTQGSRLRDKGWA